MVAVMIGIDPHKASHTATAIDSAEKVLAKIRIKADRAQVERLLEWVAGWPERVWAVENATGLGHLLTQQLLAAGEQVLDVPPKLAAKARLLSDGNTNKNDPNDVAVGQPPAGELGARIREQNVRRELKPLRNDPCLDNPVFRVLRRVPEVPYRARQLEQARPVLAGAPMLAVDADWGVLPGVGSGRTSNGSLT